MSGGALSLLVVVVALLLFGAAVALAFLPLVAHLQSTLSK